MIELYRLYFTCHAWCSCLFMFVLPFVNSCLHRHGCDWLCFPRLAYQKVTPLWPGCARNLRFTTSIWGSTAWHGLLLSWHRQGTGSRPSTLMCSCRGTVLPERISRFSCLSMLVSFMCWNRDVASSRVAIWTHYQEPQAHPKRNAFWELRGTC